MKKAIGISLIVLFLMTGATGSIGTGEKSLDSSLTDAFSPVIDNKEIVKTNQISIKNYFSVKETDLHKISLKAEAAGQPYHWVFGHIGPVWLPHRPLQFTIYTGDTEILIDGEQYVITEFPMYVNFIGFFGIGPMPFLRTWLDKDPSHDPIYFSGFCREIIFTPYNGTFLDIYDQPLFDVSELGNLGQVARGLTSADFNDDGDTDFAVSFVESNAKISIFSGNGDSSFSRDDIFSYDEFIRNRSGIEDLASGDFDGDGDIDLLLTNSEIMVVDGMWGLKSNGTVNLIFNDGKGNFINETLITRHCSLDPYSQYSRINPQLTTADYDLDGDIDFLVGDNSGIVELYLNNGDCTFVSAGVIHDFGYLSWGLTSADYDHDGDIDFFVSAGINDRGSGGYVYLKTNKIIESNGTTIFDNNAGDPFFQYSSVLGGASLQAIDYNDDANVDIIIGLNDKLYLCAQEENSFEIYPLNRFELYTNDIRLGGLTVADYNNDGRKDLVTGGVRGDVRVLWNNYSEALSPLWPEIILRENDDPGEVMLFGFVSKDINGDEIYYKVDWGDGNFTDWVGPCPSGEELQLSHVWNKEGGYRIRAKAKDSQGHESGWNNHRMVLVDDKEMNMVDCFSSTIFKSEDKTVSSKWYTNQFFYQKSFPFRCGLFENVTESDNSNILNFMK